MRKLMFVAAVLLALIVAAPVAFAEPGQNGPPGPAGNPNEGTTPAPQGPPTTSPGNSANNPHGGAPGITGQPPQTPASSNSSGNGGGNGAANSSGTPAEQAATPSAPPASTPPVATGNEPQGPPADVPSGNGNGAGSNEASDQDANGGSDGKVTICHATRSVTNPFVDITLAVAGLNGHSDHQDGEDVIPAAGDDCDVAASGDGGEGGGPDGKVTICHATASITNPFVNITISVNGLNGHGDHQDGEDIIPAEAGVCPPATGGTDDGDEAGGSDGKITICHATGSSTNPFVEITISVNGLNGHGDHQDGEDVIPATDGDCDLPSGISDETDGNGQSSTPVTPTSPDEPTAPGEQPAGNDEPEGEVLGESEFGPLDADQVVLASLEDDENAAGADELVSAGGTAEAKDSELPFTGFILGGLLLTGILMLASGIGVRRGFVARSSK